MQIPRDIRKRLESALPAHVLDFLNDKFQECEKYCEEAKTLKQENNWLHQQLHQMTYSLVGQNWQGGNQQKMGYSNPQSGEYGPQDRYDMRRRRGMQDHLWYPPYYKEEEYPEDKRGVPGSIYPLRPTDAGGGQDGGR